MGQCKVVDLLRRVSDVNPHRIICPSCPHIAMGAVEPCHFTTS
jgi:hypothetical protein